MSTGILRGMNVFGYHLLWLSIVAVSVHDGYLVVLNRASIAEDERNPVGRWLIEADGGDIRFILAAKFVGTVLVATVLLLLFASKPRRAWLICFAVAFFQACLLVYLST